MNTAGTVKMPDTVVSMREWESYPREPRTTLTGVFLPDDPACRQAVDKLAQADKLHIEERRHGIRLRATSWVGRITLGDLQITIEPKLTGMPLLRLLRYAYGLRELDLQTTSAFGTASLTFQEILIHQLAAETEDLLRRGLSREYVRQNAHLILPRGRLDIPRYLRDMASMPTSTMPCTFYPRLEDTLLNRTLLAGLRLGRHLTNDPILRSTLASRCRQMEEEICTVRLDRHLLQRTHQSMSRLTGAYAPALTLIELLLEAQGLSLTAAEEDLPLPGLLFDMNRFFQALLSRFLKENLGEYQLQDEMRLVGLMTYDPNRNPRQRQAPAPRPDYVVLKSGRIAAVLDAKYRDLWETALPRDMLYQLAIYALSQQQGRTAAILYPTLDAVATEAHIRINDTLHGGLTGRVIVRPVKLHELARLLEVSSSSVARHLFAHRLVFGQQI